VVNQGIVVLGNKGATGSTLVCSATQGWTEQLLRTFIEFLKDEQKQKQSLKVEPNVTSGDYLHGFIWDPQALAGKRPRIHTITVKKCRLHVGC